MHRLTVKVTLVFCKYETSLAYQTSAIITKQYRIYNFLTIALIFGMVVVIFLFLFERRIDNIRI